MAQDFDFKQAGVSIIQPITQVLVDAGNVIPIISIITSTFREIIDLAEKAGHNKKVCRRLAERIRVANQTVTQMNPEENDLALRAYVKALQNAKEFIVKISKSSTFMKLITAHEIENDYRDVTDEFDGAIAQLGLSQCLRTRHDIEEDRKLFLSEIKTSLYVIEEVMKDLWENEMDARQKISVFEKKLEDIREAVVNVHKEGEMSPNLQKSKIPSAQITDCDDDSDEVRRGGGQIVKKMFIAQTVAQKEIGHIESLPRSLNVIEKQVAILTELKNCQNIITFYGTMQRSGKLYIISEWAEVGDLHQYLKNNRNLDWEFKYKIASEIAGGLAFCHVYDILHHDIRSHNILLTENMTAKLSNFTSARKETDDTTQVKDITFRYRWLAPEKLANYGGNEYTKQCDIYSFGIVLWELASQEVPFANITATSDLINRITVLHERPPLIPGTHAAYQKMMEQAWHQRPIKRPTADNIFKELKNLRPTGHKTYGTESISRYASLSSTSSSRSNDSRSSHSSMPSTSTIYSSYTGSELLNPNEDNYPSIINNEQSIDYVADSSQVMLQILRPIPQGFPGVREAKDLHSSKRYEEAWPIFKLHADHGDAVAEFYVGYYLIAGDRGVPQNKEMAIEYFRRSAEKNIPDAQFRYGVALLNGEGVTKSAANDKIAIENLEKAAKQGNPNAMFNYGDLLINGAHGVTQDLEQGALWMKKAHLRGHPHAYKKLINRYQALNIPIPDEIREGIRNGEKY
ncbi:2016_t:CDS:2 [Acaulospora colombiana]|uniref:2016_t:CDS:1 n=1 Tax=Acaulospora colombiana TaxID=27376 RepID=A0ACA9MH98_9GLOM|nr:2016_t:CDS:2 [Acaulospora colombiana]